MNSNKNPMRQLDSDKIHQLEIELGQAKELILIQNKEIKGLQESEKD